MSKTVN